MNDYLLEILLREKRQEMLAEARRRRLLRLSRDPGPGPGRRLLALLGRRLGNQLVRRGEQLLRLSGAAADLAPGPARQPSCSR